MWIKNWRQTSRTIIIVLRNVCRSFSGLQQYFYCVTYWRLEWLTFYHSFSSVYESADVVECGTALILICRGSEPADGKTGFIKIWFQCWIGTGKPNVMGAQGASQGILEESIKEETIGFGCFLLIKALSLGPQTNDSTTLVRAIYSTGFERITYYSIKKTNPAWFGSRLGRGQVPKNQKIYFWAPKQGLRQGFKQGSAFYLCAFFWLPYYFAVPMSNFTKLKAQFCWPNGYCIVAATHVVH